MFRLIRRRGGVWPPTPPPFLPSQKISCRRLRHPTLEVNCANSIWLSLVFCSILVETRHSSPRVRSAVFLARDLWLVRAAAHMVMQSTVSQVSSLWKRRSLRWRCTGWTRRNGNLLPFPLNKAIKRYNFSDQITSPLKFYEENDDMQIEDPNQGGNIEPLPLGTCF